MLKVYEKDRLHAIPPDIAARHMGYASANNGAALQCLASMRYYGLLDRPRDGLVAVVNEVEAYKFAPSETLRRAFLQRFLSTPPLFAELLDRAQMGMPSDEALRYELIQRGFIPGTAAAVASVFKRSVEFVGASAVSAPSSGAESPGVAEASDESVPPEIKVAAPTTSSRARPDLPPDAGHDHIPVRLPGGRRAWIVVPTEFYDRDKDRLKAQIDLLLTQDDEVRL